MPGLIACKRHWNVGSDDLFLPATIEASLRTAWLLASLVVFFSHDRYQECSGANVFYIFLIGLQVWLTLIIILNLSIIYVSTKGTITQPEPRKLMPILLYARGFLLIVELGWTIAGTIWAFKFTGEEPCESVDVLLLVQVTTICSWFMLVCFSFGIWLTYDPLGCSRKKDETWVERKSTKVWQRRFKFLFFSALFDGNSRNAYRGVAQVVADYFKDVDLVPSDIAAGLILLQEKLLQRNEQRGLQPAYLHCEDSDSSPNNNENVTDNAKLGDSTITSKPEWMNAENGYYFYKFAAAMYGCPYYLYLNCFRGLFRLWRHLRCCGNCCFSHDKVKGDNCCNGSLATLKTMKVIEDEDDLIYASFANKVFESPFIVVLDHKSKSVVVAIRGSLSLRDALTDLVCDNEPFHVEGCPKNVTCHHGILTTASWIKSQLMETKALDTAFAKHPDYSLVVTGHSLGASAGALLAIMLKPSYPNIRCYAFGASSGLISIEGSHYCKDFVLSLVYGDDLVARLSIHSMAQLKKQVIECLVECDQPKYKVFVKGCWSVITGKPSKGQTKIHSGNLAAVPSIIRPLVTSDTVDQPDKSEIQNNTETVITITNEPPSRPAFNRAQSVYVTNFTSIDSKRTSLHIPGTVLYIRKTPDGYKELWRSAEHFNEIVISTAMGCDHMPHKLEYALDQIMNKTSG